MRLIVALIAVLALPQVALAQQAPAQIQPQSQRICALIDKPFIATPASGKAVGCSWALRDRDGNILKEEYARASVSDVMKVDELQKALQRQYDELTKRPEMAMGASLKKTGLCDGGWQFHSEVATVMSIAIYSCRNRLIRVETSGLQADIYLRDIMRALAKE